MSVQSLPAAKLEAPHAENCFDFLRFAAATMVLISHSFPLVGLPEPRILNGTLGGLGVNIFFVTSGYLIYASWERDPSAIRYLIRRSLRIFPALFCVLVFTVFIVGPIFSSLPLTDYFSQRETYLYLTNLFFSSASYLPGVFEENPYPRKINGGLWTLKYEFTMYIAILIIGMLSIKLRPVIYIGLIGIGLAFGTTSYLLSIETSQLPSFILTNIQIPYLRQSISFTAQRFPELATYFALGALFYLFRRYISYLWSIVIFLAIIYYLSRDTSWSMLFTWGFVSYCTLTFGSSRFMLFTHFGKHGDFSYGMYIYGFVVQQSISHLLGPSPNWASALTISFFITLIFAFLSWTFIEAPALSLKNRICIS